MGRNKIIVDTDSIVIESSKSQRISLANIRNGKHGLNARRKNLLNKVKNTDAWESFARESIELIDLAYLTASTGHEFALLRGKREDILFHGDSIKCEFKGVLFQRLIKKELSLVCHSHAGEEIPQASEGDFDALRILNQKSSMVISAMTGMCREYSIEDGFEW
ncbi:MAG: hypothetical protein II178_08350 [Selenomonadaceae bacterium]|nr:hypothetical protein [Selenomonadaceae bacterium]